MIVLLATNYKCAKISPKTKKNPVDTQRFRNAENTLSACLSNTVLSRQVKHKKDISQ